MNADGTISFKEARRRKARDAAKPGPDDLVLRGGDLPRTARELRDRFASAGDLFDRDGPVKVTRSTDGGPPVATSLTVQNVVIEAHHRSQPVKWNEKDGFVPVTLPERVAKIYLAMNGEWNLAPLDGVSTSPLLADDGSLRTAEGFDTGTRLCAAASRTSARWSL